MDGTYFPAMPSMHAKGTMNLLTTIAMAALEGLRLGVCAASATITWLVLVSVMGAAYLILVMAVGRFLRLAGD